MGRGWSIAVSDLNCHWMYSRPVAARAAWFC